MATIQQQIDAFKILSFQERQDIVLDIFKDIKDTNPNFKYIYETLPTLQPNEWLINDLYEEVTRLAEEKNQTIKTIETNKISKIADYIKRIKELEALDRAKENPEELLKNI